MSLLFQWISQNWQALTWPTMQMHIPIDMVEVSVSIQLALLRGILLLESVRKKRRWNTHWMNYSQLLNMMCKKASQGDFMWEIPTFCVILPEVP